MQALSTTVRGFSGEVLSWDQKRLSRALEECGVEPQTHKAFLKGCRSLMKRVLAGDDALGLAELVRMGMAERYADAVGAAAKAKGKGGGSTGLTKGERAEEAAVGSPARQSCVQLPVGCTADRSQLIASQKKEENKSLVSALFADEDAFSFAPAAAKKEVKKPAAAKGPKKTASTVSSLFGEEEDDPLFGSLESFASAAPAAAAKKKKKGSAALDSLFDD